LAARAKLDFGGFPCPTVEDLDVAHDIYVERESRDVFDRAAAKLMKLARTRSAKADAAAVLLLTWNARYFRLHPERRHTLLADLGELIHGHAACLNGYRARGIRSLQEYEGANVEALFADFQDTLGPVGTAKTLHLLAPKFFPLWDTKIREAYGVASKPESAE